MMFVAYTLLLLYAMPVVVLLAAFAFSAGFTLHNLWLEFAVALSGIYFTGTRDALGTFVVPFLTAFSVSRMQPVEGRYHPQTLTFFFVLVALFIASMLCYSLMSMRADTFVSQLDQSSGVALKEIKTRLLDVSAAYVKESLAYISLLLGVAQASNSRSGK
jgi:hypothetical protein